MLRFSLIFFLMIGFLWVQADVTTTAVPATVGNSSNGTGLPPEAVRLSTGVYRFFFDGPERWLDARKHCLSLGGDLVDIESPEEEQALTTAIRDFEYTWHPVVWTSACFSETSNNWYWVSTNATLNYTNWFTEPSSVTGQHCMQLHTGFRQWIYHFKNTIAPSIMALHGHVCEFK